MLSVWQAMSYEGGSGSAAGRIALVAVAVLAVGAYAGLQIKTRPRGRRSLLRRRARQYDPADWRTYPPEPWPGGGDSEAPPGNQERYRPDWKYGYPPGYEPYPLYDPDRSPWTPANDAARDRRS